MARPKKKPDLKVVGGAQIGHNSGTEQMDDDRRQGLTRQHAAKRAELLAAEKKTKADRMNFDKIIKSDLGANGLADIKLLAELDTPEGEAKLKAEMERQFRVARWAGLPMGTQTDLFGPDRRPVEERAIEDGKRIGMSGGDCKPPHQAGTSAYDKWIEGWHAGQAILAGGFKQKEPDAPELLRPEGNEPAGSDDFDAASDGASGGGFTQDPSVDADGAPWPDEEQIAAREPEEAL